MKVGDIFLEKMVSLAEEFTNTILDIDDTKKDHEVLLLTQYNRGWEPTYRRVCRFYIPMYCRKIDYGKDGFGKGIAIGCATTDT